jgi:hypothetical protein
MAVTRDGSGAPVAASTSSQKENHVGPKRRIKKLPVWNAQDQHHGEKM